MIAKAKVGNLLKEIDNEKLDGIMNAANGIGPMGAGIAGAIKRYGGDAIQRDAFEVCKKQDPKQGQAYSTIPGTLKVKRIIHAVTMKQPGGSSSIEVITKAFQSALILAKIEGITRLGCTALGTGIGGLSDTAVAKAMAAVAKLSTINVVFVDFHEEFIEAIKEEDLQ